MSPSSYNTGHDSIHRPPGRPFRWGFFKGPDPQRIYLHDWQRIVARRSGDASALTARLYVVHRFGLRDIASMTWVFLLCSLLASLSYLLQHFLAAGTMLLIGVGSAILMFSIVLTDYFQCQRLPREVVAIDPDGSVQLYDGQIQLTEATLVALQFREYHYRGRPGQQGSDRSELDLLVSHQGNLQRYQLIASHCDYQDHCLRQAEKLANWTGLPLQSAGKPGQGAASPDEWN